MGVYNWCRKIKRPRDGESRSKFKLTAVNLVFERKERSEKFRSSKNGDLNGSIQCCRANTTIKLGLERR